MSIIKEINELHLSLKTVLLSLVTILPFWYLSISILNINYINTNQIQIPIILSLCLTVCYYVLNLAITHFLGFIDGINKDNKPKTSEIFMPISILTNLV